MTKSRLVPILLCIGLFTVSLHACSGGAGTPEDPYQIATAEDLIALGNEPNDYDKHFILTADIDLAGHTFDRAVIAPYVDEGAKFLGRKHVLFAGSFDGNHHVIRNLKIEGKRHLGLFGDVAASGAIRNLRIEAASVRGGLPVGVLVGVNAGSVSDCHSRAEIAGQAGRVGGLIGTNTGTVVGCHSDGHTTVQVRGAFCFMGGLIGENSGSVSDCYSTGRIADEHVNTEASLGGLIGKNTGRVSRCHSAAEVAGEWASIGGLIATNSGVIPDCYSTGQVSGKRARIGGLVGLNSGRVSGCRSTEDVKGQEMGSTGGLAGENRGYLSDCYSVGKVAGDARVGGLVGANWGAIVSSCYSSGSVTEIENTARSRGQQTSRRTAYGDRMSRGPAIPREDMGVGGLVGSNDKKGIVRNCYSCAAVVGHDSVGGLIGRNLHRVERSFWDMDSSGQPCSSGGAGLTTIEARDAKWIALQGWAEDPNWVLDSGRDYPRLVWEGKPGAGVPEPAPDWITGRGTLKSPYEIHDPKQLLRIGKASMLWEMSFILTSDLDMTQISWSQAVFPDFGGTFYGDGHVIQGLKIVGGLVGTNAEGSISQCYSTGKVTGDLNIGGLVGYNGGTAGVSVVTDSYSTGVVGGRESVGGLIGNGGSTRGSCAVIRCYSVGPVIGTSNVGGLLGHERSMRCVVNCFWDTGTSGQGPREKDRAMGLTMTCMQDRNTYLAAEWDFVGETENGTEDIWWIDDGRDYPHLSWEVGSGD